MEGWEAGMYRNALSLKSMLTFSFGGNLAVVKRVKTHEF